MADTVPSERVNRFRFTQTFRVAVETNNREGLGEGASQAAAFQLLSLWCWPSFARNWSDRSSVAGPHSQQEPHKQQLDCCRS